MRVYLAFLCFFRVLFGRPLPEQLVSAQPQKALPPAGTDQVPVKEVVVKEVELKVERDPADGALLLLGLLQREARLVDFLREEIAGYDDASIGAAVRDIHKGCRKVLDEHFGVEVVLDAAEGDTVDVPAGFDAHQIRLTGNVVGKAPFKGALRHHGWRAAKIELPKPNLGTDLSVLAPAEVEIS
jgi:Domain of unknown function (DUF2760)